MTSLRKSSLDPVTISNWHWKPFLDYAISAFSRLDNLPCDFPEDFLCKEGVTGSKAKPIDVVTNTWACTTPKLRLVRAVCLQAGKSTSVFNFVAIPSEKYDIPFFGADFVTLPSGHLIVLDLQPVLINDVVHVRNIMDNLLPISFKNKSIFPDGGEMPVDAKKFFSPGLIWTRLPLSAPSDEMISHDLMSAFKEYLDLYINVVDNAISVSKDKSELLLEGQQSYLKYRATKDPARGMLTRFYGPEWTESYINEVLFRAPP